LDVEASLAIVDATHEFVDLFKVGRANYLKEITRTTDWRRSPNRQSRRLLRRHARETRNALATELADQSASGDRPADRPG
jgi:hypothetical protein